MEEKFYLTRNKNGELHLGFCKRKDLTKNLKGGFWHCSRWSYMYIFSTNTSSDDLYPEVKWEDKEPTEVEITIKNK